MQPPLVRARMPDESAVLATARDFIKWLGKTASVDASEAGQLAHDNANYDDVEFWSSVVDKILEFQCASTVVG